MVTQMKEKAILLINKYTKEEVYTRNYDDVIKEGTNEFIRVFQQSNPQRTFLVNRQAFVVSKKS
jgi:hypothetical protein